MLNIFSTKRMYAYTHFASLLHFKMAFDTDIYNRGGCFLNISRALPNNLAKIYNVRNSIYDEYSSWKFVRVPTIHKFRENIFVSSRKNGDPPPPPTPPPHTHTHITHPTPAQEYQRPASVILLIIWRLMTWRSEPGAPGCDEFDEDNDDDGADDDDIGN